MAVISAHMTMTFSMAILLVPEQEPSAATQGSPTGRRKWLRFGYVKKGGLGPPFFTHRQTPGLTADRFSNALDHDGCHAKPDRGRGGNAE